MGNSENLIISTYFFKKFIDPEKQIYIPMNEFNVIKNLYRKVTNWDEADVRILHDGLDREFITRYSKKWIKFVKVDTLANPMSPKDIRLIFALEFIKEHPEWTNIFIIDNFNVKCITNPFRAVNNNNTSLFIASQKKLLSDSTLFMQKLANIGEEVDINILGERPVLNSDIIGGNRNILIPFLEQVQDILERLHELYIKKTSKSFSIRHTMIALNYVSLFYDNILTGNPLHTTTVNYKMNGNSEGNLMFTFDV